MRHGKSDWDASYDGDHDRPLNSRGKRSARVMGRYLAAQGQIPDLVISSTAARAKTTAELAIEAGLWSTDLVLEGRLYDSGPRGVLEVAAEITDRSRVMMVGHQPTWSLLILALTGSQVSVRTGSVAELRFAGADWSDTGRARGTLVGVVNPRDLFGSVWDAG
jgi:phosphohistidine phosphatase